MMMQAYTRLSYTGLYSPECEFSTGQGVPVLYYHSLDSTNNEAKRLFKRGRITQKTVLVAHTQTAGRGTQGREWISPAGAGLYISVIDLASDNSITPFYTMAAGIACIEALTTQLDLPTGKIGIKPVNDLYAEGQKLGGILVEGLIQDNVCQAIITGIGINFILHPAVTTYFKHDTRHRPTSLAALLPPGTLRQWQQTDPDFYRLGEELTHAVVAQLDTQYASLASPEGINMLKDRYAQCCIAV
jgi:hypothetical protein